MDPTAAQRTAGTEDDEAAMTGSDETRAWRSLSPISGWGFKPKMTPVSTATLVGGSGCREGGSGSPHGVWALGRTRLNESLGSFSGLAGTGSGRFPAASDPGFETKSTRSQISLVWPGQARAGRAAIFRRARALRGGWPSDDGRQAGMGLSIRWEVGRCWREESLMGIGWMGRGHGLGCFALGSHVGALAANRRQVGPWQCNRPGVTRAPPQGSQQRERTGVTGAQRHRAGSPI